MDNLIAKHTHWGNSHLTDVWGTAWVWIPLGCHSLCSAGTIPSTLPLLAWEPAPIMLSPASCLQAANYSLLRCRKLLLPGYL